MSSSSEFLNRRPDITWENLLCCFPDARFTLFVYDPERPEELVAEWASPKQLETFPNIIGRICYEHSKGFSQPCEWCPCLLAAKDGKIHAAVAPSPRTASKPLNSIGTEPALRAIAYALLVAVPLKPESNGTRRVLEISLDWTREEITKHEHRLREYEFSATLCRAIEQHTSLDVVDDFALFGAVAEAGMGFSEAHLFLLDEVGVTESELPVSQARTLVQNRGVLRAFARVQDGIFPEKGKTDLASLRGILFPLVGRVEYSPPRPLEKVLSEHGCPGVQQLKERMEIPVAFRLSPHCAAFPVLGDHRRLHGVLSVQCHRNTLISDDDLSRISIYALFVSGAYAGRDIRNAYDRATQEMQKLTRLHGDKVEDLLFTAPVISGLGHDLRNSRRRLSDWFRTLIREIPKSRRESMELRPILEEVEKLLEFQRNCLARITNPDHITAPWFAKCDLKKLVLEAIKSFQHTFSAEGVNPTVHCTLTSHSRIITCDPLLIRQVLTNLIDNSLHWMSDSRRKIDIRLVEAGSSWVRIEYRDTGTGIAQEIREQLWEPFFTLKPGGMGLGLYIVKRIVRSHNGSIDVFPDKGWGACFRIELPIEQPKRR